MHPPQIEAKKRTLHSCKMLDAFEIITTTGVVLWSRSTSSIGASAVNSLINDVFIEEKTRSTSHDSGNPTYKYDRYTLKYTLVRDVGKGIGLIFVVRFQRLQEFHETETRIGSIPIVVALDVGG